MNLSVEREKDGAVNISVEANTDDVAQAKTAALEKLGAHMTVKGFRQGKAPPHLVEPRVKEEALVDEILNVLVNRTYLEAIREHNLTPIANPEVDISALRSEDDPGGPARRGLSKGGFKIPSGRLKFSIKAFVAPKVKLGEWREAVQNVGATRESPDSNQIEIIFDTLIDTADVTIAGELISRDVDHQLFHQAQAVAQTGMKFEDYLKSQGDNLDDYRDRLRVEAERRLRLRFILPKVAEELEIKIEKDEDVEKVLEELKALTKG